MARTKKDDTSGEVTITLTPEEIATIMAIREGKPTSNQSPLRSENYAELAQAFITAIETTKPPSKKTIVNRTKLGAFDNKDGTKKPKLKRGMFHHGVELNETILMKEEIELLNKIKPGSYCSDHVKVIKRKDRGLDIDYPVKTAAQRLKLVNQFGVTSFASLLQRLINEAANPKQYHKEDEEDWD